MHYHNDLTFLQMTTIAAEEIDIDLNNGVKVNYEKFYRGDKGALAKIK